MYVIWGQCSGRYSRVHNTLKQVPDTSQTNIHCCHWLHKEFSNKGYHRTEVTKAFIQFARESVNTTEEIVQHMTKIVTPADRQDISNSQVCAEVLPHQLDLPLDDEVRSNFRRHKPGHPKVILKSCFFRGRATPIRYARRGRSNFRGRGHGHPQHVYHAEDTPTRELGETFHQCTVQDV